MAVAAGVVRQHVDIAAALVRRTAPAADDLSPSLIAGFWLLRKVIGNTALNGTDEETLAVTLRQLFELLLPSPRDR
ncbi:hypothetical protein ACWGE0_35310 [Lentzea sp. NPDC054927]